MHLCRVPDMLPQPPGRLTSTRYLDFSGSKSAGPNGSPMPSPQDAPANPQHSRSPGLAAALAVLAGGIAIGLGMAAKLGGQFTAGLVIVAVLGLVLARLQRVAENTRTRMTAGEASYRAFFDHAVD